MANKITKRERFEEMRKIFEEMDRTDLIEFVDHELELLDKKASSKTMTATQKENEKIMATILTELATIGTPITITDLLAKSSNLPYTNQKVSALMKKMVRTEENPAGQVARVVDKKKAYFSLIEE